MIDINALTLGEISKIEELSGSPITLLGEDETPKGAMLAALVFITKRRSGEPTYTWNDAQGVTLDEANAILGLDDAEGDEDVDPTPDPSKGRKKPSTD